LLFCAAAFAAAQCFSAVAQPATRLKARLTAVDGRVMTLEPLSDHLSPPPQAASGKQPAPANAANTAPLTVSITPATRYVSSNKAQFADIKLGDYAGAAISLPSSDQLRAQEVFAYADALRGTGEGRFPEGDRLIVNGTVSAINAAAKDKAGTMTLHYHGSVLTGLGRGKTVCEGRASPPAYASALACEADAVIEVAAGTPVSALREGNKSLLVPGSTVTVAVVKAADGNSTTPGVVVEALAAPEKPAVAPVEKQRTQP
jgi:hypothetical protein